MASGIVIVKQYERMVVLRFGRWNGELAQPGFRFLIPIVYTGRIVDVREQVERVPTQKYITKDNVVVDMDFVLYYRVLHDQAEKSILEVADHRAAVRNLAVAELRSIIGNITLAEALGTYSERIEDPGEIIPAIGRAREVMATGRPALLEFMTKEENNLSRYPAR